MEMWHGPSNAPCGVPHMSWHPWERWQSIFKKETVSVHIAGLGKVTSLSPKIWDIFLNVTASYFTYTCSLPAPNATLAFFFLIVTLLLLCHAYNTHSHASPHPFLPHTFRFHMWERTWNVRLSEPGLFCLTRSPVSFSCPWHSFPSYLWLVTIPPYVGTTFLSPFTCADGCLGWYCDLTTVIIAIVSMAVQVSLWHNVAWWLRFLERCPQECDRSF